MKEDQGASLGLAASGQGSLHMAGGPGLIAVRAGGDTYSLQGDGIYAVPEGVQELVVMISGGGGAAGDREGGSPGEFKMLNLPVAPGQLFRYSVGKRGLPGVNGGKGGDSVFEEL